ncbi:aminoglycoside phosphotransferase family protein [Candidatus Pelagibacter communis]|uniref:aminoglycoside phosphotransferase family protein n=1 Tax=Pelagibacter ubique TaxID=198252 RepID=UPI00094BF8CE|nr:phosphotransferase [Candidatus Pelagibacter ubique]
MKLNNKKVTKLEGDASERKFYRSKNSIIIFSKKNKKKNLLIYDVINKILNSGGINAPKMLKNNYKQNFIEVNDLGDTTLFKLLNNRKNKKNIFMKVLDLLFKVQKIKKFYNKDFTGRKYKMTRYSKDKLLKEAYLFNEWYLPRKLSKKKLNKFKKKFKNIFFRLSKAIKLPDNVFVHRDFHVSNIMLKQKKFHLIDSQDAVIGNPTYDLASLIDDVRLKTSNSFKKKMFNHFTKKFLNRDLKKFENDFLILSVLRNFKILGIFSRLAKRDGKKRYLKYIPYTWSLIKLRTKNGKVFDELRLILNNNKFI